MYQILPLTQEMIGLQVHQNCPLKLFFLILVMRKVFYIFKDSSFLFSDFQKLNIINLHSSYEECVFRHISLKCSYLNPLNNFELCLNIYQCHIQLQFSYLLLHMLKSYLYHIKFLLCSQYHYT